MNVEKRNLEQFSFMVNVTVHDKLMPIDKPYGDFIPCLIMMYLQKKQ